VHGIYSSYSPLDVTLPRQYDLISVISLFTHLPEPLFRAWIARLVQALTPNGLLVLTTQGPTSFADRMGTPMTLPLLFLPESESLRLSKACYGSTYVTHAFVRSCLTTVPTHTVLAYYPQGLNEHQDVYVIGPPGLIPSHTLYHSPHPRAYVDSACIRDGTLLAKGWAVQGREHTPADSIELFLPGEPLGHVIPNQYRPDVARAFGSQRAVTSGWRAECPLSRNPAGHTALALRIYDARGFFTVVFSPLNATERPSDSDRNPRQPADLW
jgi:hypothetical protein